MAEEGRVNIMSVEFAVQRELAYREKVANLMPPSKMNTLKNFSTLQVPSPSQLVRPRPQGPQPSQCSSSEIPSSTKSNVSLPRPQNVLIPGPTPVPNQWHPGQSLNMNQKVLIAGPTPVPNPSHPGQSLNMNQKVLIPGPTPVPNQWHPGQSLNMNQKVLIPGPTPVPHQSHPGQSLNMNRKVLIPGPTSVPNQSHPDQSFNMNRIQMPQQRLYGTTTRPRHFELKRKATSSLHRQPPPLPVPQQPRPMPPPQNGIISVDQHGIFFCKVCQVQCTGPDNLKSHIKGSKHKSKLQQLQMAGNNAIPPGQQGLQCELCGIFCSDQNGLEMHFKGQKHKAKVEEMESGSKKGEETSKPWCELCQIWCMNEDALQQHFEGQKHIARLYSSQGNARPASGNL